MDDRLVTIAQFSSYIETEMGKKLLAEHGIKSVIAGENASILYSIPAVEIPKLQVLESCVRQAKEILESKNQQE